MRVQALRRTPLLHFSVGPALGEMRALACSAEFTRKFEDLARKSGWSPDQNGRGLKKHTVQALSHHFCIGRKQVYEYLKALELQSVASRYMPPNEVVHPSILIRASRAGKEHTPQVIEKAVREGWTTKQIDQEVRRLKRAGTPQLPKGQYDVILADPPWEYSGGPCSGAAANHYPTMSLADLKALPVESLAALNATLFLWVTNPQLSEGLELAEAWGFTYKTNMAWVKKRPGVGIGYYVRGEHELLFICTRGSHVPDRAGRPPIRSVFEAAVREHSRKPEAAYKIIESMYPDAARRLELFARGAARPGWAVWGNEADPRKVLEATA